MLNVSDDDDSFTDHLLNTRIANRFDAKRASWLTVLGRLDDWTIEADQWIRSESDPRSDPAIHRLGAKAIPSFVLATFFLGLFVSVSGVLFLFFSSNLS